MEIEAKFAIPDRTVYRRLARLRSLARFALRPTRTGQVADRYFDTADGRLRQGGYACRLRVEGDVIVATLKGLGGATGAVHRRAEEEVQLAQWSADPAAWPDSPARTLALELTAGAPLRPLFDLTQRRGRADLLDGERRVAELSLDAVRTDLTGLRRPVRFSYYELEVELAPAGHETDLAEITAELAQTWQLQAEPRSKYERALDMLRQSQAAEALNLTPHERRTLEAYAATPAAPFGRRAAAVLGWEEGLPATEIASRVGLSAGRVRYWVRAFRADRLAIFGDAVAAARSPAGPEAEVPAPSANIAVAAPPPSAGAARPTIGSAPAPLRTVKQLAAAHGVDLAHGRRVADHAGVLFDALKKIHKLPEKRRRLLRRAALLNTVGAASDPAHPHAAGRDIILAAPLQDVNTMERLALACILALGGGKLRSEREPTMAALDEKIRRDVLALAALARLAEALDASRTQSTEILAFAGVDGPRCEITLAGPTADRDAAQANQQADAWRQIFKQSLSFVATPSDTDSSTPPTALEPQRGDEAAPPPPADLPPLAADDPMSEAGRKVLALHFGRMLANEAGTRLGADPEALHDMRVATRRMRAAFALFEPYYDAQVIGPFGKGLRRTGRTLGAVRDLDVLLEKARRYAETLPAEMAGIEPLLTAWEAERVSARQKMLEYLDSPAYRKFVVGFGAFLATPGAGAAETSPDAPPPTQARHVIPWLILTRYASVRAYERLLPAPETALTTYHALRIECKGLRYALEFFRELLGEETPALIQQVTALQDLLGELQDAYVAEGLLADFLAGRRKQARKQTAAEDLTGIEAYLAAQHARQTELLTAFPAVWAKLIGPEFRRRLALAIATI